MMNRPLYHNLMKTEEYFQSYRKYFDRFVSQYFESGRFQSLLARTREMIAPYVEKDPTAFCSYEDHRLAADTLEPGMYAESRKCAKTVGMVKIPPLL